MVMEHVSLHDLSEELIGLARSHHSGRAARSVRSGRDVSLRQTVIALRSGASLADHPNPGEASLQVLVGNVVLHTASERTTLSAGDWSEIPDEMHGVDAVEDSVMLLTVAMEV